LEVVFEGEQTGDESVFKSGEAVEGFVVEMFFTQFIPKVFLGIEFRAVGREEECAEVVRQNEFE
jgi:hypothetical protein